MTKHFDNKKSVDEQIRNINKLGQQIKELQELQKALKDDMKAFMETNGLEELKGIEYRATYQEVIKQIVDNKALKADGLFEKYCKPSSSHVFNTYEIK